MCKCSIISHKICEREVLPIYKETFTTRLKAAREQAGYTQLQTAKITGIARASIAKYETGGAEPSIETLGILAQFYNISLNWLLGVTIEPPVNPHDIRPKS